MLNILYNKLQYKANFVMIEYIKILETGSPLRLRRRILAVKRAKIRKVRGK